MGNPLLKMKENISNPIVGAVVGLLAGAIYFIIVSFIISFLWNKVVTDVFSLKEITAMQAFELMLLTYCFSKIA